MTSPLKRVLLAAALLALAGPGLAQTAAQTVYKYQRPDGSLVYSDEPIKGARLLERFRLARAPAQASRAEPARTAEPRSEAQPPDRALRLDGADAEVQAAQKAVDDARGRLQQGVEPLPGERAGNVGGKTTRLTEDYFARVQRLERDLKDANARLEQAYDRRNDAK